MTSITDHQRDYAMVKEWELQAYVSTQLKRMNILHHGDQNAGKRGPQAAAMMKATGACRGWPDMVIVPYPDVIVFVEFKTGRGSLSKEQKELHENMQLLGFPVKVVQTDCKYDAWDQVRELLQ